MLTDQYCRCLSRGLLALGLIWTVPSARAQVSAEESLKQLKPADGLKVSLWASEPMVVNPTNIDIDSRGRVWVTEGLNYRLYRSKNGEFERIKDADKVKILEDTDGDGKADKMTVFADNIFPVPMGIAVEEHWSTDGKYEGCKVFIGNSPDLLVLEDTDGDDKADKRYPLLTGFGGKDSDHGVHGMVLGLDGKLYFTHGDGCCSVQPDESQKTENFNVVDKSGRHVWTDQLANTLRVNRDGTQFEIIADRQRNNYETCFNSFGNQFTSDNDDDGNRGCRIIWVMDGAHYGYHTPGSHLHWGEDVPGNVPKLVGTGNGSPCGVMVYEGSLLPEEYQGAILEAEAGPRVINYFPLTRVGAAFRTEHKVMLSSEDNWFRPVDVCAAPDGSVFIADWYDGGVGGHAFRDQTTGRIYRIAPEGKEVEPVKYNFGMVTGFGGRLLGCLEALNSPNVAARDVARRLLIKRLRQENGLYNVRAFDELVEVWRKGTPEEQARAIWVLEGYWPGMGVRFALNSKDPKIREMGVRIAGRDCRENGHVEYQNDEARKPAPAEQFLDKLLPLADDPDAGVRRELVLALRNLPTEKVGDALRTLAAKWDGQDRWYLEALGLALREREPEYISSLFDGSLYGPMDLENAGQKIVALPPYFPTDRNEAYMPTGMTLPPASSVSKTLGLAWELHRVEALPLVLKMLPGLKSAELRQAVDDVINQVQDPAGAAVLADVASESKDPLRRRQAMASLAKKLGGHWRPAAGGPKVVALIESALNDPDTLLEGVMMAGGSGDRRYSDRLMKLAEDQKAPQEMRVEAIEAVARVKAPGAGEVLEQLLAQAREDGSSSPAAEAAVRALPRLGDALGRLRKIMLDDAMPLGLRREALRNFAVMGDGGKQLLGLAKQDKIPGALRTEAASVLRAHPTVRIRDQALELFPIRTKSGRPLPSASELARRNGDAARGRSVFFTSGTNACASCHRVQGRGQWIGPDLSTIGTKYGKDELLRSILNPSEAISYNFHSLVLAMEDGRVLTGLPVEDTPSRTVLKLADGQRVAVSADEVEARRLSEVSLMPEGLAEGLDEQEIVDLLAFLSTLRRPVSIVGEARAVGPLVENDKPVLKGAKGLDVSQPVKTAEGEPLAWRRISADAEGRLNLVPLIGGNEHAAAYLLVPVTSATPQNANLVLDTRADVKAWLDDSPIDLSTKEGEPLSASLSLPEGTSRLLVRVPGGPDAEVVATLVSDQPLEFSPSEARTAEGSGGE